MKEYYEDNEEELASKCRTTAADRSAARSSLSSQCHRLILYRPSRKVASPFPRVVNNSLFLLNGRKRFSLLCNNMPFNSLVPTLLPSLMNKQNLRKHLPFVSVPSASKREYSEV